MKKVSLIILIILVGIVYFLINKEYQMHQYNPNQEKASVMPTSDSSGKSATFNYPGLNFKFSYPIQVNKGATTVELAKNVAYEIRISNNGLIKIYISKSSKNGESSSLNPNQIKYSKFIGDDKVVHILFYNYGLDDKDVEIIIDSADEVNYSDMIISSFEFVKTGNPQINY